MKEGSRAANRENLTQVSSTRRWLEGKEDKDYDVSPLCDVEIPVNLEALGSGKMSRKSKWSIRKGLKSGQQ